MLDEISDHRATWHCLEPCSVLAQLLGPGATLEFILRMVITKRDACVSWMLMLIVLPCGASFRWVFPTPFAGKWRF